MSAGEWEALGGEDTRNASEVVGDADIRPGGIVKERPNRGKAVIAKLENEQASRLDVALCLRDESSVNLEAFLATVESKRRLVFAHFDRKGMGVTTADVGRIANDEIKREWLRANELREGTK